MINSRAKGKRFELQVAEQWKGLIGGNPRRTSYVSKHLDDQGVDLTDTDPFLVQCKAVERSLNYHDILDRMPIDTRYPLVVHKRNGRKWVVALYFDDFAEVVQELRRIGVL